MKLNRGNIFLVLGLGILLFLVLAMNAYAKQETCPDDNGWVKIDSDDLSSYPVQGATDYCFKAGSDNSNGCNGGIFDSWPQPNGTCGLSHWSYYVPKSCGVSPTVIPTSTPSPTVTVTPTVTVSPTPEPTPKVETPPAPKGPPEWEDPCFYLRDSEECKKGVVLPAMAPATGWGTM